MSGAMNIFGRLTRKEVTTAIGVALIAVIVICVVIIVLALLSNGLPSTQPTRRTTYPTTRVSAAPARPTPYYKNCREAHAANRWDIPKGDPAYRPGLDHDGNGIACESRKPRG